MERNESIRELIQKNPVNKGLDYGFVNNLIIDVVHKHFPELKNITTVTHEQYKRRVGKHNSTFIYTYTVSGTKSDGTPIAKKLVYSSHSDGSRKHAYVILQMLAAAGFNDDGTYQIIVPLEFYEDIQTLVYESVPGKTLYQHMQGTPDATHLTEVIRHAAAWIKKFHRFPLHQESLALVPIFESPNFNPRSAEFMSEVAAADALQGQKLSIFITEFFKLEKELTTGVTPALLYGDLHPENIITETLTSKGLTMIDFTDVTRGDQMRDIGSFVQQLQFMGRHFYEEYAVDALRQSFLEHYFGCPVSAIPIEQLSRVNLYQAWNSLRSFMYFFAQEKFRQLSYGLLEDAWRFLNLADEKKHYFTITYNHD